MHAGPLVLLVVLVVATAFGLWRAWADGRFRGTHRVRGAEALQSSAEPATEPATGPAAGPTAEPGPLTGTGLEHGLGERATLLQFSSAFCAPCRATRRTLGDVAATVPGVVHVEIDAEQHLELVRRVGVLRTPTTLVLDAEGREVARAAGAPRKEAVLSALASAISR